MSSQDGFFSVRTVMLSGMVVVGTGMGFMLYQQRLLAQSQDKLMLEVQKLRRNIAKLEKNLKKVKQASPTESDFDEIFVDASESTLPILRSEEQKSAGENLTISPSLKSVLDQIDEQLKESELDKLRSANETLKHLTQSEPDRAEVYWRLAKSFFLLASDDLLINPSNDGSDNQKGLMKKAFEAAQKAVNLDNECGEAYKWLAIIRGSITQYLPMQEQIKSAYDIKEDIMASLRYNPKDSLSFHMLGRWCFSVYSLSWLERRIAATLFASPPVATLEEAMDSFLKAEELSPKESLDNCLYLAKCYLFKKDYNQVVYWLREGLKINGSSRDDLKSIEEMKTLLAQYESYATQ
ncbi:regulator of microtubule dynamics protein [Plakobranchus ocellatus]|uniref:Regulator of microtubule dynamics protein 1 n=1 Tax=Plakobranchus ocellatus TaxID=259542 RepID=A0AAV4A926_9GAST|nr:regulator of microtubule dynamics protein [Plakobranchus ocellatus]